MTSNTSATSNTRHNLRDFYGLSVVTIHALIILGNFIKIPLPLTTILSFLIIVMLDTSMIFFYPIKYHFGSIVGRLVLTGLIYNLTVSGADDPIKSFLQIYTWVYLAPMLLMMIGLGTKTKSDHHD